MKPTQGRHDCVICEGSGLHVHEVDDDGAHSTYVTICDHCYPDSTGRGEQTLFFTYFECLRPSGIGNWDEKALSPGTALSYSEYYNN